MAHAMRPAADSEYLRANPDLSFQHGPYTYRITTGANQSIYSITDGEHTLSIPLLWAYGVGVVGQTFIFRREGIYYETEAAYYPVLHRLSIVAGLPDSVPSTLQAAFGLPLVPMAAQQCIACHTTAAVTSNQLHVNTMIRGVTCEACHGPGSRHVALMEQRAFKPSKRGSAGEGTAASKLGHSLIFNPASLSPAAIENFCGECHRTSRLVVSEDLHGLDTVHYEPYRLEMSQCWIMTRRITCVTCHDPHQPLDPNPAAYDPACLSCHPSTPAHQARTGSARLASRTARPRESVSRLDAAATSSASARSCPVATKNCTTCHMPKCRLPRAPFSMSDHFIRIVGPNDPCSTKS